MQYPLYRQQKEEVGCEPVPTTDAQTRGKAPARRAARQPQCVAPRPLRPAGVQRAGAGARRHPGRDRSNFFFRTNRTIRLSGRQRPPAARGRKFFAEQTEQFRCAEARRAKRQQKRPQAWRPHRGNGRVPRRGHAAGPACQIPRRLGESRLRGATARATLWTAGRGASPVVHASPRGRESGKLGSRGAA
jgi:hypothetical protein